MSTGALAKRMLTNHTMEFLAATGFYIGPDGKWIGASQSFDSLSMSNLFNSNHVPDPLPTGWSWLLRGGQVTGAGDKATASDGRLRIDKWKFTWSSEPVQVDCTVIEIPRGATMVIGSRVMVADQDGLDMMLDLSNYRCYIVKLKLTVRLDWLPTVLARLHLDPINIMSWYGGLEPAYDVLRELGFNIDIYLSIENCPVTRQTALIRIPDLKHCAVEDARHVTKDCLPSVEWFGIIGTPPCQMSSRRNAKPVHDTSLFECMGTVVDEVLAEQDLPVHLLYENVVPHSALTTIRGEWDRILRLRSQDHNAADSGSMCARPRLYWSNSVNLSEMPILRHRCPEAVLEDGYLPQITPMHPVVAAGDRTQFKLWCVQRSTNFRRTARPDERDRMVPGLAAGYSGAHNSDAIRNIGNGNSLSADVLWSIARVWAFDTKRMPITTLMTAADIYSANSDTLLLWFGNMTIEGGTRYDAILDHLTKFAANANRLDEHGMLITPELEMRLNRSETLPARVGHACDVPGLLAPAAAYCVALLIIDTTHRMESCADVDDWVSMMFFQPKGKTHVAKFDDPYWGLYKKGDVLQVVRPLVDKRCVNFATSDWIPIHWGEMSPDRMLEHRKIPPGTCRFKFYDAKNAYFAVKYAASSLMLALSKFRLLRKFNVFIRALRGEQGNAWMGTFFSAWIFHLYRFFVGDAFMDWILQHVDDILCHGVDDEQCQLKFEVVMAMLQLIGLAQAPKMGNDSVLYDKPVDGGQHVGFFWTRDGHCVSNDSMEMMKHLLTTTPKGGVQVTKLRGLWNQVTCAIDWSSIEDQHWLLKVSKPLNDAVAVWQRDKVLLWKDEQKAAVAEILDKLLNLPRRYCHPEWVVSDDRCLVGQGDCDPARGVSWHLFSVAVADASKVTPEMLHDPTMSVLLCMHVYTFGEAELKWHVFEGETFCHIHGAVRKCGKYINTCLAPYICSDIPKYAWGSDSMITIFRLPKLTLPEMKVRFLCAKIQRFMGWSDESAMTKHWSSCRLHTPDVINNLADACVRVADQLRKLFPHAVENSSHSDKRAERNQTVTNLDSDVSALPVAIHTFHQPVKGAVNELLRVPGFPVTLPVGTAAYTLLFTQLQWSGIAEAYTLDNQEISGARMSEIHSVLHNNPDQFNSTTVNKIRQWGNRTVFPLMIAGAAAEGEDDHQVLYTPATATRDVAMEDTGPPDLLLMVPDNARVRMSEVSLVDYPYQPAKAEHDYAKWCLREDIIWLAHNTTTPHATLNTTIAKVKEQVWFKGVEEACKSHVDTCAICLALRLVRRSINDALRCSVRFWLIQVDDKVLSKRLQEVTGYWSITSIVEMTHPVIVFKARKTRLARDFVVTVYTGWNAYYGTPMVIASDLDPAMLGKLARFSSRCHGTTDRVQTVKGLKMNQVETANKYLSEALEAAEAKGDIVDADTLLITVAAAQQKAMQVVVKNGSTNFERLHGVPANTSKQLLSAGKVTFQDMTSALSEADPMDRPVMTAIRNRCQELIEYNQHKLDQTMRTSKMAAVAKPECSRAVDFSFKPGEKAAIGDVVYTVQPYEYMADNKPSAIPVKDSTGKSRMVRASYLRPLSVDKHEVLASELLPDTADISIGTLVFFECNDMDAEGLLAGTVLELLPLSCVVQICQPKRGAKTWLPRWEDPNFAHKILRHKKCPAGCTPFTETVATADIITTGEFSGPACVLTDDTIYRLRSMGYTTEIRGTSDSAAAAVTGVNDCLSLTPVSMLCSI